MPDTVIIGGGFAGLAAAVRLSTRGHRVRLLERRPLLGGRAYSFSDAATGDTVDNGQHLLMRCCGATLSLLETIGTRDRVAFQDGMRIDFRDAHGRASRMAVPRWLPAAAGMLAGFLRFSPASWGDVLRLRRIAPDFGNPPEPGTSVAQWLAERGQSTRMRAAFWDPLCISVMNARPEDAPAEDLARVLGEAFSERGGASLGYARVGLSGLHGAAARTYITDRGGSVDLGAAVTEVALPPEGVSLTLRSGDILRADACIAAIPPPALARLLPADGFGPLRSRLARYRPSPILSVNLWFSRPPFGEPFLGLVGGRMDWVFNKGRIYEGGDAASPGHVVAVASAADRLVPLETDALIDIALEDMRAAGLGVSRQDLRHATVVREKQATYCRPPGDCAVNARTTDPRLTLAGDWTATGLPPTIESAVRSGFRAADILLGEK